MAKIIIEPHYLGSLEYYVCLLAASEVIFEIHQHFTKQTYKNRCRILTANGTRPLIVPVKYGNRTAFKDVKIDHGQSWARDHRGAICSSYGKAPFFEFFADYFKLAWDKKHTFLLDLNTEMTMVCLKLLQHDLAYVFSDSYNIETERHIQDFREHILPKKPFDRRNIYCPIGYPQAFGSKFEPNLSVLDLIMNEGPGAMFSLRRSIGEGIEQNI